MDEWLAKWGYLAVATGAFLEGEAVLLMAGALAHKSSLMLPWVMVCGFIGSSAWSQLWFQTGRFAGDALVARWPSFVAPIARAHGYMSRYAALYLLLFRFVAGMGTASPAAFGMSGFSARRFLCFDMLGAAVWSAAISSAGFGLGLGLRSVRALMGAHN